MRVLCIDRAGDGLLDTAIRAQSAGHQIKFFLRDYDRDKRPVGKGLVDLVPDWRPFIRWADLVLLSANDLYMNELDRWRAEGVPIIGGGVESASWEHDRAKGMAVFRRAGIAVPEYREFTSYEKAADFVRRTKQPYASKPSGNCDDKSLSYVAKTPEELIFMLERWQKIGRRQGIEFILQEKVDGIEMGVAGWFGPAGFVDGWEEDFEFKKMAAGDVGENTGELGTVLRLVKRSKLANQVLVPLEEQLHRIGYVGNINVNTLIDSDGTPWPLEFTCYDDQTEVLTEGGWKLFSDVYAGEHVATLNPATNSGEYRPVKRVIEKPYVGEMLEFSGSTWGIDLCVTPDHAMWVRNCHRPEFEFVPAQRLAQSGQWAVARTAKFAGSEPSTFTLPEYTELHYLGRHKKYYEKSHPAIEMPIEVWLRFLGLYISEGSIGQKGLGKGYQVNISQGSEKSAAVAAALKGFPISPRVHPRGFEFNSVQLATWLMEHVPGYAQDKRIPRAFMSLSPRLLGVLLDALILGDGSVHKRTGGRVYTSSSPGLADDVHEIITRMGNLGRVKRVREAGSLMAARGGTTYTRNFDGFIITEVTQKTTGWVDKRQLKRRLYKGSVYCLNVPPHHLLYVRRNGRAQWCGNCRFGWPAWNIETTLYNTDPIEFLYAVATGETPPRDTRRLNEIALGAYLRFLDHRGIIGAPIYGPLVDNGELNPAYRAVELMVTRAPVEYPDGSIRDAATLGSAGDHPLLVTATGTTVRDAQRRCYSALDKIHIPGSPFHRNDIGARLKRQLPRLQELGFATGMEF